jgi:hypothetical protein
MAPPPFRGLTLPRSLSVRTASNLSTLWVKSAVLAWETALAAPQVIALRTARMAAAGIRPDARDSREFARMSHEKGEACVEAMSSIGGHLLKVQQQVAMEVMQQWLGGATHWWSLALRPGFGWPLPAFPAVFQAALPKAAPLLASLSPEQLALAGARIYAAALTPIHRRATANARRLDRERRRRSRR